MQKIRQVLTKKVFNRAKGWECLELDVELVIDDDAIIERLAVKAYHNRSGSSSYMNGAVVIRVKLA